MATLKLWTDEEVSRVPRIQAVFDDIRLTRNSDFVNNFWRALANQPDLLERRGRVVELGRHQGVRRCS